MSAKIRKIGQTITVFEEIAFDFLLIIFKLGKVYLVVFNPINTVSKFHQTQMTSSGETCRPKFGK